MKADSRRAPHFAAALFSVVAVSILAMLVVVAPSAIAQEKLLATETHRDWAVFVDGEGASRICYAASPPLKTEAFRGGNKVDRITRGEAFLIVATYRSDRVSNEVSIRFGYPADADKEISLTIGDKKFDMFTADEVAWLSSPEQDGAVIEAMRDGSKAVFTATSSRGTTVVDEYSLLGFTASIAAVARACS